MPQKNTIKTYVKNSYYHVYNRGVEERIIFQDESDYLTFLNYLKTALSPLQIPNLEDVSFKGQSFKGVPRQPKNFNKKIELIAFCLMPNHFHLLVKQNKKNSMEGLMRSLITRYSMYFNKKYKRTGSLFQGRYKAVLVEDNEYLLHLSRYIHRNPVEIVDNLDQAYSSYPAFLGKVDLEWIKPNIVIDQFNNSTLAEIKKMNTYKNFVESYKNDSGKILGKLALD